MYLLTYWVQGHLFHHLADVREYSLDQHHHHVHALPCISCLKASKLIVMNSIKRLEASAAGRQDEVQPPQ